MSQAVYPNLPGLTFPVLRVPQHKTQIMESVSGREYRSRMMTSPRVKYTLKYEFLRDSSSSEFRQLVDFFNARNGDFDSFLFTDPDDNSVTAQPFGTGDGATKGFQLLRTLSSGGFAEPVYDLNGTPTIYVAGVAKVSGTDYSINSTGFVTFTTAPTSGQSLTWTGSYYWRCRFMQNMLEFSKFVQALWEVGKVEFITVKP